MGPSILAALLLTAAPDYSGQWLVIEKTETKPGPGLVDTTPYSGLRPGLHILVSAAMPDEAAAQRACDARKAKGAECYVKFAGQAAGAAGEIEAALEATSAEDILYRLDLELRGRKVPLIVRGKGARTEREFSQWCEEGWIATGLPTLYWAAEPLTLPSMKARKSTCCTPLALAPSPPGVTVLRQSCSSPSCGGGCFKDTWAIVIPENHIAGARAEYLECYEDLSLPPNPRATCDELKTSKKGLRFTRTTKVRVRDCPDQEDAWEKITKRVVTTTYLEGRLVRRTREVPHLERLWGCEE